MDNQFKRSETDQVNKESFKTPEQVAVRDTDQVSDPIVTVDGKPTKTDGKKKFKLWPPTKFTWILAAIILVLLAGGGYLLLKGNPPPKKIVASVKKVVPPVPTTVASSLTGLQVSPATNALPISAVMVENSTEARPQSGLGQAGVVFEALAEGGITRFVALYQSDGTFGVGPVRSARPYFISWILGFDAAYAHVGGSPEALSEIKSLGVHDLDEFANGGSYERIPSRPAPHNVYTSPATLYKLEQAKGYTTSTFTSFVRKPAAPLKVPTATTINLKMSSALYNVSYAYAPTTNSYNRSEGGTPHVDANTNIQISPQVVIAMVVPEANGPLDGIGAYYSEYATVGSGTVYVFQDGGVTTGSWTKSANTSQIVFTNSAGQPLALNPGQTWITAVSSTSAVSYQ